MRRPDSATIFTALMLVSLLAPTVLAAASLAMAADSLAKEATTDDPAEYTITIINDEDFRLRTSFEAWMNGVSKLDNATGATAPTSYMQDAYVYQLGRSATISGENPVGDISATGPTESANVLRAYRFIDIFPTNVAEVPLSYETGDTIEEFTVEFQVQYFEVFGAAEAADLR